MKEDIALTILSRIINGSYSVRGLTKATGYSPNTVVSYLSELEDRGLIKKEQIKKLSRGRPPILLRCTEEGLNWYRIAADALFQKLSLRENVLWGPRRSFALQGIDFVGMDDILSKQPVATKVFDVIVDNSPMLYENPQKTADGSFMSPQSLVLWATESGEPRKIAAAAALISKGKVSDQEVIDIAIRSKNKNKIGFISSLIGKVGISGKLKPDPRSVKLLKFNIPQDPKIHELAREWHVLNPISRTETNEIIGIYS